MNPEKLKKLIQEKEEQKKKLAAEVDKTNDVEALKALKGQISALNDDITALKNILTDSTDSNASSTGSNKENKAGGDSKASGNEGKVETPTAPSEAGSQLESRSRNTPVGGFNPMATYIPRPPKPEYRSNSYSDPFSTLEYRQSFMDYVVRGVPIPDGYKEARSNEFTIVGDIGAVIPTTVMQKVIEEALAFGMILPRVTRTAFQGGLEIPLSDIKPVAVWITEEDVSPTQKKSIKDKIVFTYHQLECRVGLSLLSETVSLPVFETVIIRNIKEAMIVALETSIIRGTGTGQPKGILKETIKADRIVTLDQNGVKSVAGWAEAEAAVPLAYESGASYLMAKSTWEKYLNGATDSTGQKLGFVSISDNQRRVLNGREVLLTDYIPGFDKASAGDIIAVLVNPRDYVLNSNLNMTYKKYFNEDTNKWVHKSIMIADGKMIDTHGMVYVKKA